VRPKKAVSAPPPPPPPNFLILILLLRSKIPALVDKTDPANPINVFESGAIMVHLAEKYPDLQLLGTTPSSRAVVMSWLMWQMASAPFLGGGFGHFYSYAPKKFEYPINRYAMESKRQLHVLDTQLSTNKYVCGDNYSLADIAIWPWYGAVVLDRLYSAGEFLNVKEYPNVIRWAKMLEDEREAVRRGRMVNRTWGATECDNDDFPKFKGLKPVKDRLSRADMTNAGVD